MLTVCVEFVEKLCIQKRLSAPIDYQALASAAGSSGDDGDQFAWLNSTQPRAAALQKLDFKARLSVVEVMVCLILPLVAVCTFIYGAKMPRVGVFLKAALAALYVLLAAAIRAVLLE